MRQIKYFLLSAFLFGLFFSFNNFAFAAGANLVNNPDMEAGNATSSPDNWQQDQWGTNMTTFEYKTDGHAGKSLYVKMSGYQDGDAKWFFNPVEVLPDTDYTFSDYYKSNVKTAIVAMSIDAQGNPTYFDVSTVVPASSLNWKQVTYKFRTLPDTKTLTILHLIQKNGWLQTDDYKLTTLADSLIKDLVPNNSMETVSAVDSNLPQNWFPSVWGTSTPVFEYANDGHDGARSVKIIMSNYESGDAKWEYTPQALEKGKDYKFTAWYKSDVTPHVVVKYVRGNNTEDFFGLPDPISNGSDWQQYSGVFNVPQNVKKVTVSFFISENGTLQTDDYRITPYKYVGFNRPIVSISFDDGFESNVNTVLPVLDKYGFKVTYCYATQYVEGLPDQVVNAKKISDAGHETCSHTVNHLDLTQQDTNTTDYELSHSKDFLASTTGQQITTFTTPFGTYNPTVIQEIQKYFKAHRTTDEGYNSKDNLNPYKILVQNMQLNTTLAQFKQWVNKAKADNSWLVLVYHAVDTGTGLEEFDTKLAAFKAQMQWLSTAGVTVERIDQALAEVQSQ